jgi:hypothetical protein
LLTCSSPVRRFPPGASSGFLARLACVRRTASVRPEPGSNSPSRSRAGARRRRPSTLKRVGHCGPLPAPALELIRSSEARRSTTQTPALAFGVHCSVFKERRPGPRRTRADTHPRCLQRPGARPRRAGGNEGIRVKFPCGRARRPSPTSGPSMIWENTARCQCVPTRAGFPASYSWTRIRAYFRFPT